MWGHLKCFLHVAVVALLWWYDIQYSCLLICCHIIDGAAGARHNSIHINFTRLVVTLFSFTMDDNYSCSNILSCFSIQIFFDRQDQWWRVVRVKGSQGHEEVSCGEKKWERTEVREVKLAYSSWFFYLSLEVGKPFPPLKNWSAPHH